MSLEKFLYTISDQFIFEVALGNIPGYRLFRKFFELPSSDSTIRDVWDFGGTEASYTYTAEAGADYYIASSSALDTGNVVITIHDETGLEVSFIITLQGQTPIKINDLNNIVSFVSDNRRNSAFKCVRCYRIQNLSDTDFLGVISISEGDNFSSGVPGISADVRAQVLIGNNGTLMSQMRIPSNEYGLFLGGSLSLTRSNATTAEFLLNFRKPGSVFIVNDRPNLNSQGTTSENFKLSSPILLDPSTDIVVKGSTALTAGIAGAYYLLLVNERFAKKGPANINEY